MALNPPFSGNWSDVPRLNAYLATLGVGGGGSVPADTVWDAKGDLVVGTGADTAAKLSVGTNAMVPIADSSQATGIRWGNIVDANIDAAAAIAESKLALASDAAAATASRRTLGSGATQAAAGNDTRLSDARLSRDVLAYNGNSANVAETFSRRASAQGLGAYITSGVMFHTAIWLPAGFIVTSLTSFTANVTPSAITNWWFALYDNQATPALMAQTADQLTTAIPNLSKFTLALSSPQTIVTEGVYYAALMVKATTPPSFATTNMGIPACAGGVSPQVRLQGTSGSGLSTTAPATIASPANGSFGPVMVAT